VGLPGRRRRDYGGPKLGPEQVQATLAQSTAAVGEHGDVMVLAVVLRAGRVGADRVAERK
jgi:hypothetical protein